MDKKIYRVALVGCGTISSNHVFALQLLDNVEIVALCDLKEERALTVAERFSLKCKIYTDYEKMLCEQNPDAVHICTPHYLHAQMTVFALERDINVFLEKPMCMNEAEIDLLISAEAKSKASVCVSFQNRTTSAVKKALEVLNADGGATSAYFSVFWQRNEPYYTMSGWRGKKDTEGGGVMINQAIHSLDMLTLFFGKPKSVIATTSNHHLKGVIDVEDSCEGLIRFENGKQANFYATTSATGTDDTHFCITSKNHRVFLDLPNLIVDGKFYSFENEMNYVGKACYGNGHAPLIRDFYRAIDKGKEMPIPLDEAKYALKILLAAYKSNDMEIII